MAKILSPDWDMVIALKLDKTLYILAQSQYLAFRQKILALIGFKMWV